MRICARSGVSNQGLDDGKSSDTAIHSVGPNPQEKWKSRRNRVAHRICCADRATRIPYFLVQKLRRFYIKQPGKFGWPATSRQKSPRIPLYGAKYFQCDHVTRATLPSTGAFCARNPTGIEDMQDSRCSQESRMSTRPARTWTRTTWTLRTIAVWDALVCPIEAVRAAAHRRC